MVCLCTINRSDVRTASQDLCYNFQECGECLAKHPDLSEHFEDGSNFEGLFPSKRSD